MSITLTREEAQHVLYSLIFIKDSLKPSDSMTATSWHENLDPPIETLRARLSAPEPDAPTPRDQYCYERGYQRALEVMRQTPQRQWQGLTDEAISAVIADCQITLVNYCSEDKQTEFARAIEAKLREKNFKP